MIVVKCGENKMTIEGHARYAEHGKDIVCAAVTILMQTLIVSLEQLTTEEIKHELSPGWAMIEYGNLSKGAKTLVDSFFIGIRLVEKEFPNNVRVEGLSAMT